MKSNPVLVEDFIVQRIVKCNLVLVYDTRLFVHVTMWVRLLFFLNS